MPLDTDVETMLTALAASGAPSLSAGTVEQARANYDAAPKPPADPIGHVVDRRIAGDIEVRCYAATPDPQGLPIIMFFHGGGWVLSSVDGHDSLARRIARMSGALVVSVEYRLAPEAPFPAAHDDCWAATTWCAANAHVIGGDPTRLVVCGDSAGGNLAAGIALRARDEGFALAGQVLIYPCIDSDTARYESMTTNGSGYLLSAADMIWFWDHYVPAAHRSDPYAVPANAIATGLAGVAPALVITADYDPLRDEGERYARALAQAGVPTELIRYRGVIHGFVSRWHAIGRANEAHDAIGRYLRTIVDIST